MREAFTNLPPLWRCEKLKHVADYRVSNVDKLSIEGEEPVSLYTPPVVYPGVFFPRGLLVREPTATLAEIRRFHLESGDVVITKDSESWDDIAVPALIEETAPDLVCGYHLAMVRGRSKVMDGRFLFRCFQSGKIRSQLEIEAMKASTGIQTSTTSRARGLPANASSLPSRAAKIRSRSCGEPLASLLAVPAANGWHST